MYLSEHILKVWAAEAQQKASYHSPLFPPSPYYRFFQILAEQLKPKLTVVLGVCGGGCCLHFCLGNPEGKVIGVDLQYDHPQQLQHIENKCSNFIFYQGDSIQSAEKIFKEYGPVDLMFIDTVHTYEATKAELKAWKPYLAKSHLICFDDLRRVEMGGFWKELSEPKLRLDDLHPTAEGGFGVVWSIA